MKLVKTEPTLSPLCYMRGVEVVFAVREEEVKADYLVDYDCVKFDGETLSVKVKIASNLVEFAKKHVFRGVKAKVVISFEKNGERGEFVQEIEGTLLYSFIADEASAMFSILVAS